MSDPASDAMVRFYEYGEYGVVGTDKSFDVYKNQTKQNQKDSYQEYIFISVLTTNFCNIFFNFIHDKCVSLQFY